MKLEIPKELLGKKIVLSPEMFVSEMGRAMYEMVKILQESEMEITEDMCKEYMIRYLQTVYANNINSKPTDPEEIQ